MALKNLYARFVLFLIRPALQRSNASAQADARLADLVARVNQNAAAVNFEMTRRANADDRLAERIDTVGVNPLADRP